MQVRVRWSETITKEAVVTVDDVDDATTDAALADVADDALTSHTVEEREVLEYEVVDAANVTVPADVKAPAGEGMW